MRSLMTLGLLFAVAEAKTGSSYETSLYTGTLAFFILMLAIIIVQMRRGSEDKKLLQEKDEKITWLRQVHAENEHRKNKQIQELEKEIMTQRHAIDQLEMKLQEGTKNQVVSKIEALQNERKAARDRLASTK